MRVYISADIEGVAGVVSVEETDPQSPEYDRARKLMIDEINAAIEGALVAGATDVLVNDGHLHKRNIIPEALHPSAQLLRGEVKMLSMMAGVDRGFDAAFFMGYHTRVRLLSRGARSQPLPPRGGSKGCG